MNDVGIKSNPIAIKKSFLIFIKNIIYYICKIKKDDESEGLIVMREITPSIMRTGDEV